MADLNQQKHLAMNKKRSLARDDKNSNNRDLRLSSASSPQKKKFRQSSPPTSPYSHLRAQHTFESSESSSNSALKHVSLLDLPTDVLLYIFSLITRKPHTPILPLLYTCSTFHNIWKTFLAPSPMFSAGHPFSSSPGKWRDTLPFHSNITYKPFSNPDSCILITKMDQITKRPHSPQLLEWAKSVGCPWNTNTTAIIARNGNLPQLQSARKLGCPWDEQTTYNAAANGHLDCLAWAKDNGCAWNDIKLCSLAAYNGRLDILKWIRQNGGQWNEDACSEAASGGHLNVLQWLRENGCPWDSFTCLQAWYKGHMNILHWARNNSAPFDIAFVIIPV